MREVTARVNGDVPVTDAASAAAVVPEDGTLVISGFGSVGYPKAVPRALLEDDRDLSLTVVSGGSVGEEIDVDLVAAGKLRRRFPYQARPEARSRINAGELAFHDRHISLLGDEVAYHQLVTPDVAVVEAVAVGEDWFVPSTSIGPVPQFVESASRLVVEVNDAQPLALQHLHDVTRPASPAAATGDRARSARIQFDPTKLAAVVRTDAPDSPYTFRDLTAAEEGIGAHLASHLSTLIQGASVFDDAVHLQFGVGSIGNALMSELGEVEFDGRDVVYAGEVIQDGLLDMLDEGLLASATATSLALSEEGQRRLFADVRRYAADITVCPADVSNDPSLIRGFHTVGVNSAVEVDIYGHANSTHVNGTHIVNGIGGSGDFIRNSLVSIVALPSTAGGGKISRIVPMVSHVDHTEHDVDCVVTEHGVADLRGRTPTERAEVLISRCAHPEFRPALREYVERAQAHGGHIPHDLETAFDWHISWRDS